MFVLLIVMFDGNELKRGVVFSRDV